MDYSPRYFAPSMARSGRSSLGLLSAYFLRHISFQLNASHLVLMHEKNRIDLGKKIQVLCKRPSQDCCLSAI